MTPRASDPVVGSLFSIVQSNLVSRRSKSCSRNVSLSSLAPFCSRLSRSLSLSLRRVPPPPTIATSSPTSAPLPGKGKPYSGEWQQTINNAGVVAAYANSNADDLFYDSFVGDSPFLWYNGTITPLPELPFATDTIPLHINNNGQVVGRSTQPGVPNHPVLWDREVITVLPELPGDNKGGALTINGRGQAAGYS